MYILHVKFKLILLEKPFLESLSCTHVLSCIRYIVVCTCRRTDMHLESLQVWDEMCIRHENDMDISTEEKEILEANLKLRQRIGIT